MGFLWEADCTETADHKGATTSLAVAQSMGHFVNTVPLKPRRRLQLSSGFKMLDPATKSHTVCRTYRYPYVARQAICKYDHSQVAKQARELKLAGKNEHVH